MRTAQEIANEKETYATGNRYPVALQLVRLRHQYGLTQSTVAKELGVKRSTISSVERGENAPSILLALRLAQFYRTSVEHLFEYLAEDNEDEENSIDAQG